MDCKLKKKKSVPCCKDTPSLALPIQRVWTHWIVALWAYFHTSVPHYWSCTMQLLFLYSSSINTFNLQILGLSGTWTIFDILADLTMGPSIP